MATLDLLGEVGYGALTIGAVAGRAVVGRPTVYRRHGTKAELVAAALTGVLAEANPAAPDTGDVVADLATVIGNTVEVLTATTFGRVLADQVGPAQHDDALAEVLHRGFEARRDLLRVLLGRAADEGRLLVSDIENGIDILLGALYFRLLMTQRTLDRALVAAVIGAVVAS